jgi:heme O synthase-like polyprenyltransferase
MNKLYKVGIIIPLLAVIIIPMMGVIANAQAAPSNQPGEGPITSMTQVESLLENILGWIYTFFFIFAAIFILIAAFQYLTAAGDEEKVKKAKNMLIYAVIAIAIALVAMGIDNIVANLVGATPVSQ